MASVQSCKLNYTLKIFQHSEEDKFIDALDVYRRAVSRNEKTNTNEIIWCLDNPSGFSKCKLFFFGLELNNKIIGYSEIALIKKIRYITIDYLVIDETYKTHSAFYTFLLLIVQYFTNIKLDYDFIGIELLTDDNGMLSKEELSEYELEGFHVVNTLYIQPCLEPSNYDSQHEAILLIYQRNTLNKKISCNTYLDIVHAIYFDYYYEWDSHFYKNDEEKNKFFNKLQESYEKIKMSLNTDLIILNGYPFTKMSSENKVIPNDKIINKKLWQALFFTIVFSVLVLGIMLAIKKLNFELTILGIIFVLLIFIWLAFLAFSENKAFAILEKLPIISKIFENTK